MELCLKLQFIKGVDFFRHMDMIAVGDITFICNAFDDAKAALETLGKFIGGGFNGSPIQRIVDILGLFPLRAFIIHILHDTKRKRLCFLVGVTLSGHGLDTLVKAGISQRDGGVPVIEQFVNRLALFQAGQRTVLPMDRGCVGKRAQQSLVTQPQRPVAQLQPFVKDLPEFFKVSSRGERNIGQVDGDNTLINIRVLLLALTIS